MPSIKIHEEVVILENRSKIIFSLLAMLTLMLASSAFGAATGAVTSKNLLPTFHKGFSAGLRSAPSQCVTEVRVDYGSRDFARTAREACEKINPRKGFCVDFCLNKVNRDRLAARQVTLVQVPKAACMKPLMRAFSSPEECMKDRTKHCAVNCERGKDQAKCSRQTMVECRKIGKGVYKIV